jgi:hypothetical protein
MKKYRIKEEYWVSSNYPFYYYIIQRRKKFRFWKWVNIPPYIYKTYEEAEIVLKALERGRH